MSSESTNTAARDYDFDLFTIGAGSGGVAASRRAAGYGAKVGLCESSRLGGTCVMRGCVPKKLLVYASEYSQHFADSAGFGWQLGAPPSIDWPRLIDAKNTELDRLEGIYGGMLERAGVQVFSGRGEIVDPHTVRVGDQSFTAQRILIATGGRPVLPAIPGVEHAISSDQALELRELPRRVLVVGGGYIGVEFAGIFAGVGAEVTQVLRGPRLLRGFDQECADYLGERIKIAGIELLTGTKPLRIERHNDGLRVELENHEGVRTRAFDTVLMATGRKPNTDGIGLERVGINVGRRGEIPVDRWSKTSVPSIYAVGDVTDNINLTPVAIAEGRAIAETEFNSNPTVMDHNDVASAVFSQPPLATVGLSTEAAREQFGDDVALYRSEFRPMRTTISGRNDRVLMKLVVRRSDQRVLGCHMVGGDAPEIVQGLAIAIKAGATKAQFDATVGIHPSSAEEFVTMYTEAKPA